MIRGRAQFAADPLRIVSRLITAMELHLRF